LIGRTDAELRKGNGHLKRGKKGKRTDIGKKGTKKTAATKTLIRARPFALEVRRPLDLLKNFVLEGKGEREARSWTRGRKKRASSCSNTGRGKLAVTYSER